MAVAQWSRQQKSVVQIQARSFKESFIVDLSYAHPEAFWLANQNILAYQIACNQFIAILYSNFIYR